MQHPLYLLAPVLLLFWCGPRGSLCIIMSSDARLRPLVAPSESKSESVPALLHFDALSTSHVGTNALLADELSLETCDAPRLSYTTQY